ncbi:MAG TPA: hypothetical protein VK141_05185 [Nitrosomonas sp.]|nr:hypothetical protein [Nitrosomonas sp.]
MKANLEVELEYESEYVKPLHYQINYRMKPFVNASASIKLLRKMPSLLFLLGEDILHRMSPILRDHVEDPVEKKKISIAAFCRVGVLHLHIYYSAGNTGQEIYDAVESYFKL